jgi:hypothetical protein
MLDEDTEFDKAVGQFRLALNIIMGPLRLYGQNHYVDSATEEIVSLAVQLHNRLLGVDEPYHVNHEKLHY